MEDLDKYVLIGEHTESFNPDFYLYKINTLPDNMKNCIEQLIPYRDTNYTINIRMIRPDDTDKNQYMYKNGERILMDTNMQRLINDTGMLINIMRPAFWCDEWIDDEATLPEYIKTAISCHKSVLGSYSRQRFDSYINKLMMVDGINVIIKDVLVLHYF